MSMCRVMSYVVGRACLLFCCDQCVLLAKLTAFALFYFVLQGQTCWILQVLLTSYFCIPILIWWKGPLYFSLMLALEGFVGHQAAAAAAKLLQSCQTLCDPTDGSPPGPTVPGILLYFRVYFVWYEDYYSSFLLLPIFMGYIFPSSQFQYTHIFRSEVGFL